MFDCVLNGPLYTVLRMTMVEQSSGKAPNINVNAPVQSQEKEHFMAWQMTKVIPEVKKRLPKLLIRYLREILIPKLSIF